MERSHRTSSITRTRTSGEERLSRSSDTINSLSAKRIVIYSIGYYDYAVLIISETLYTVDKKKVKEEEGVIRM